MPRTKKPSGHAIRIKEEPRDTNNRLLFEQQNCVFEELLQNQCRNIDMSMKIFKQSLSAANLKKTILQMKNELAAPAGNTSQLHVTSHSDKRKGSDDDEASLASEKVNSGRTGRTRTSRSLTRNEPPKSVSRTIQRRRSRSAAPGQTTVRRPQRNPRAVYQTPAYNKTHGSAFPPITPKVAPNKPLTIMRQPRQGEMIMSMSGSPLMVPSHQADYQVNCNIPLDDGTMISLMPEKLRPSQDFIPSSLMDDETLQQLTIMQENLTALLAAKRHRYDST